MRISYVIQELEYLHDSDRSQGRSPQETRLIGVRFSENTAKKLVTKTRKDKLASMPDWEKYRLDRKFFWKVTKL